MADDMMKSFLGHPKAAVMSTAKPTAAPASPPPQTTAATAATPPPTPPPATAPVPLQDVEATTPAVADSGVSGTPAIAPTKTRLTSVLLVDLPNPAEELDEFGNRFVEKYKADNLEDLIESIRIHGMIVPPVIFRNEDRKWSIISGHRRIAVLFVLAARKVPGFELDRLVNCLELLDASYRDLVIQSIIANELSQKLDNKERLLVVKKANDAGATKKEIAASLGVSDKAIERDLETVRDHRVLQHVLDDHLPPTTASVLVKVASAQNRLDEFVTYFDEWVKRTQAQIVVDDARSKAESGKGLRPSKMAVMSRLEPHVVRGWLDALAKGNPLTEAKDLGFEAKFDKKTGVATIRLKVDTRTDEVNQMARVASQASQVVKLIAASAQTRHALEAPAGPQAALMNSGSVLDLDLLREFDLEDLADQLQQELDGKPRANLFAVPTDEPSEGKE